MVFNFFFIIIWIGIITLLKDKLKKKIKTFLNINTYNQSNQNIIDNLHKEYQIFKHTLNTNIISIKDELSNKIFKTYNNNNNNNNNNNRDNEKIKTNELDMFKIFEKTKHILKNFIINVITNIKHYLPLQYLI